AGVEAGTVPRSESPPRGSTGGVDIVRGRPGGGPEHIAAHRVGRFQRRTAACAPAAVDEDGVVIGHGRISSTEMDWPAVRPRIRAASRPIIAPLSATTSPWRTIR